MSDPKYVNIGEPDTCLIEECSELINGCSNLIKIICKANRFGYFNFHPNEPEKTNIDHIKAEMDDVVNRCSKMEQWLNQKLYDKYSEETINSNTNPTPHEGGR